MIHWHYGSLNNRKLLGILSVLLDFLKRADDCLVLDFKRPDHYFVSFFLGKTG